MKPADSLPSSGKPGDLSPDTPLATSGVASRDVHLGAIMHKVLSQLADDVPGRSTLLMVLAELIEIVDSERIFLFRLRKTGGFQVLAACNRDREPLHSPERRMSHYAVKTAMATEKQLLIPDARHDRRYRAEEVLDGKKGALSILVLPLRVHGELYGGIYADHRFQNLQPAVESEALRAWLSIAQLVLSVRARHRDLRRRHREMESQLRDAWSEAQSSSLGIRATHRMSASQLSKWIDEKADARNFHGFLSANPDLRDAFEALERLAAADLPVLICGETGTGKSLLARAIHQSSGRGSGNFLPVHCGSVPDSLIESELLGHVRGAFSGAELDRDGILVQADGGTLFLDEVGDMGGEFQKKLLRVLEDGVVRPIGAKEAVRVNVRVVSATRHRLESQVERGQFRGDLYFRLKGVVFEIPPIRERREDICPLCRWFLSTHARAAGRKVPRLTREAWLRLVDYSWPGNAREIENEVRRLVALGVDTVGQDDLNVNIRRGARAVTGRALPTLEEAVSDAERKVVAEALRRTEGNKSQAAQALRITRKSLYRRMKKYGLT